MEFQIWIKEIISNWENSGRSETQLAISIGINQATLNAWKNGTRGKPKTKELIDKLIDYFSEQDPRVYAAIGLKEPVNIDLSRHKINEKKEPEYIPILDEWNAIFFELTPEDQQEILEIARMKANKHKIPGKITSRIKKIPARNALKEK